jgi:biotin carboxyl carrier protein
VKYITTITPTGAPLESTKTYEIEIDDAGLVHVHGRAYRVDMCQVGEQMVYSLLLDEQSYEVHVESRSRQDFHVIVSGEGYEAQVQDELSYRLAKASSGLSGAGAEAAIKAPIPGLVVKVNVKEGDVVEPGQPIVILEAMKMENELRAPRAGTVAIIHAQPGDSVNQGETLVTLQ